MNELSVESIAKLELAEGDALVITTAHRIPVEGIARLMTEGNRIGEAMRIPHLPVVVLEHGVELSVVKKQGPGPASYEELTDTLTIFGIKYSVGLFRQLAFGPIGGTFRIVGRDDGTVVLESLHQGG